MALISQKVAFLTLAGRECHRFLRIWKQSLLPPLITQSLYFVIFGGFLGARVGDVQGVGYAQFIVPGLVMMGVINGAFSNVAFSFFAAKFQRSIDELLVAPVKPMTILAGYVAGGTLRGMLTGFLIFLVSVAFVHPMVQRPFVLIAFGVLAAILFSIGGLLNGLYAKSFDDAGVFTTFILTPLIYLSGIFYPISTLAEPWQTLSRVNPILYLVSGMRAGFFGTAEIPVLLSLGMVALISVILGAVALRMLKTGKGLTT